MEQMNKEEQASTIEKKTSKEIDVVELFKQVMREKKLLCIFIAVSAVIGVIVALATPKEYTSQVVLAPETSGMGLSGNLGSLASTFGVNLGSMTGDEDAISPDIYPEVLSSTDFILHLFDVPVRTRDREEMVSYKQHLIDDAMIPFWTYPRLWLRRLIQKKDSVVGGSEYDAMILSMKDEKLCEQVRSCIGCRVSKRTSTIYISVNDQDPLVAAILADTLQSRLQAYIIDYRTKKAQNDYAYYSGMCDAAEEQYIDARQAYASYADSHYEVILEAYRQEMEALENDMQLKYNVYNQMLLQKESAEAKIQERTPSFTILESSYVSNEASSIPRTLVVLIFMFIGCCADILWVLWGRRIFKK